MDKAYMPAAAHLGSFCRQPHLAFHPAQLVVADAVQAHARQQLVTAKMSAGEQLENGLHVSNA